MSVPKTVNIGLLGLGTVGQGVVNILRQHSRSIEERTGVRLVIKRIAVRSLSKKRSVRVPANILTDDARSVVEDPSVDVVVELIGGIHPAKELIEKALERGKNVVTANKALLAEHGDGIFRKAEARSRRIGFEASVCAGIPIISSLKDGLASNDISHFFGIVNGTCNYILSAMHQDSASFDKTLKEAQEKGYAEQDPSFDIDGIDSKHKLAILARLAFRTAIPLKAIYTEGIRSLSIADVDYAKELGYSIKLLAIAKKTSKGLELRVHPTMIPQDHLLSGVRGVYNAVFIHGDQAGDLLFYGKGAGMFPTASAVMSDIMDIAKNLSGGAARTPDLHLSGMAKVLPIDDIFSKYYLRFQVEDKPGMLGWIAQTLGKHNISILTVHQKEAKKTKSVPVLIMTYDALEADVRKALREIDAKKVVREKTVVIRVER